MKSIDVAKSYRSLSSYQKNSILSLMTKYMSLNEELSDTHPSKCPHCGSNARIIKKGFSNSKQRYQCKECGSKFTYDAGGLTSWSHQSADSWVVAIEDTLLLEPIEATRKKIGVCHTTAFYMRHKILCAIEQINESMPMLDGIIEADEAYVLESEKGTKVTSRKARKHGAKATKRGLSSEQLCVCTATDRSKSVVLTCVNRAKASSNNIYTALEKHISDDSIFLCDGADSYNLLIKEKKCQKIELIGHESYNKVYHLNNVNGIHSDLSKMIKQFRGVASKYLNRYLALLSFLESNSGISVAEKADCLRKRLLSTTCFIESSALNTNRILAI